MNHSINFEPQNPFTSPKTVSRELQNADPLHSLALLGIIFNSFTLLYLVVPLVLNWTIDNQSALPKTVLLIICLLMMVVPAIGLAGSYAMLKRRHYRLSRLTAICMMTPLVGPCFGLTLPIGLWALVYLNRKDVKETFADTSNQLPITVAELN